MPNNDKLDEQLLRESIAQWTCRLGMSILDGQEFWLKLHMLFRDERLQFVNDDIAGQWADLFNRQEESLDFILRLLRMGDAEGSRVYRDSYDQLMTRKGDFAQRMISAFTDPH